MGFGDFLKGLLSGEPRALTARQEERRRYLDYLYDRNVANIWEGGERANLYTKIENRQRYLERVKAELDWKGTGK